MKRIRSFTTAGILGSLISICLLTNGHYTWASAVCLLCYFLIFWDFYKITSLYQSFAYMYILVLLGITLNSPLLIASLFLSSLAMSVRYAIMTFNYVKNLWVESTISLIAVSLYIVGNTSNEAHWNDWLFPALPLILSTLISVLDYKDRKELVSVSKSGYINVGTEVPDFSLPDQNGNMVRLSDYKGRNPLLLIFVRGDWCPGCHIMLRAYEKRREKLQEKNVVVMAIGPDPVGVNLEMVQRLGLEYKLLSDEKQEAAKKYCIKVQSGHPPAKLEFLPLPASFLINDGVLLYSSRADRAGEILDPYQIFSVLESIPK